MSNVNTALLHYEIQSEELYHRVESCRCLGLLWEWTSLPSESVLMDHEADTQSSPAAGGVGVRMEMGVGSQAETWGSG